MDQPVFTPVRMARLPMLRLLSATSLAWAIITYGALLRIAQYVANRSLWLDEARLALNIVNRDFLGLTQPLQYNQAAPIGFLWLERLAVVLFGSGERALRLVPLLAGLFGLVLCWRLAQRCLPTAGALAALACFAVAEPLITYSSEVKQYTSDVAITLMLTLCASQVASGPLTWRRAGLLAVGGATAIWFSHPALFVLAGIGLVLLGTYTRARDWRSLARLIGTGAAWLLSFGATYMVSLQAIRGNARLQDYWGDAYMPLPPTSLAELRWFPATFSGMFDTPGGFRGATIWLAMALFIVGAAALARSTMRTFWLLTAPGTLALAASGLHAYPFDGRLLLFLAPALFLLIGAGVAFLGSRLPYPAIIQIALIVLLVAQSFWSMSYAAARPPTKEELRPLIAYIQQHDAPDDVIYVYNGAEAAYRYYAAQAQLPTAQTIYGIDPYLEQARYRADLAQLHGRRAWIVFSHVHTRNDRRDDTVILHMLDDMGQQLATQRQNGASLYLYQVR